MKCPRCHKELATSSKFCSECGHATANLDVAASAFTPKKGQPQPPPEISPPAGSDHADYGPTLAGLNTISPGLQPTQGKEAPRGPAQVHPAAGATLSGLATVQGSVEGALSGRKPGRGRYEIIEQLGSGGMGEVWKAYDKNLTRRVAIKFVHSQLGAASEGIARFLREARVLASVEHPNIVRIYDVDEAEKFISMEFVEGESVSSRVRRDGPLELNAAISIAVQVGHALAEVHKKGVVHRDIKPSNILLTPHGAPKLIDFGIAHVSMGGDLTVEGATLGTPVYIAPEQLQGSHAVDARADIYSLGATLYEMVTGQSPKTIVERRIPEAIRSVVLRAVAEKPSDRFPEMASFTKALQDYEQSQESLRAYREAVEAVLSDGILTGDERAFLQKRRQELGISLEDAQDIENEMRSKLGKERLATRTSREFVVLDSLMPERKADLGRDARLPEGSVMKGDIFVSSATLDSGCEVSGSIWGESFVNVGDNCNIKGGIFSSGSINFGGSTASTLLAPKVVLLAPPVLTGGLVAEAINPGSSIPSKTRIDGAVCCTSDLHIGQKCRFGKIAAGANIVVEQGFECADVQAKARVNCGDGCRLGRVTAGSIFTGSDCSAHAIISSADVEVGEGARIGSISAKGKVTVPANCEIGRLVAGEVLFTGSSRVKSVFADRNIVIEGRLECACPILISRQGRIEIRGQLLLDGQEAKASEIFGLRCKDQSQLERLFQTGQTPASWFLASADPDATGQIATILLTRELNQQLISLTASTIKSTTPGSGTVSKRNSANAPNGPAHGRQPPPNKK